MLLGIINRVIFTTFLLLVNECETNFTEAHSDIPLKHQEQKRLFYWRGRLLHLILCGNMYLLVHNWYYDAGGPPMLKSTFCLVGIYFSGHTCYACV